MEGNLLLPSTVRSLFIFTFYFKIIKIIITKIKREPFLIIHFTFIGKYYSKMSSQNKYRLPALVTTCLRVPQRDI